MVCRVGSRRNEGDQVVGKLKQSRRIWQEKQKKISLDKVKVTDSGVEKGDMVTVTDDRGDKGKNIVGDDREQDPICSQTLTDVRVEVAEVGMMNPLLVDVNVEEEEDCEEIECETNIITENGSPVPVNMEREVIQGRPIVSDEVLVVDDVFVHTDFESSQRGAVTEILEWECGRGKEKAITYVSDEEEGQIPNPAREKAYDSEPEHFGKDSQQEDKLQCSVRKSQLVSTRSSKLNL